MATAVRLTPEESIKMMKDYLEEFRELKRKNPEKAKEIAKKDLYDHQHLKKSENEYDWIGNGIYFWENNYQRARDWARNRYGENGMVVGAVLAGIARQ